MAAADDGETTAQATMPEAPEADVQRLLDMADRHSSWLDDLRNPVPVTREVHIVRAETA